MKLNQNRLAPIHAASTDETRYNINAIRFDGAAVVATNGHMLVRVTTEPEAERPNPKPFSLALSLAKDLSKIFGKRESARIDADLTDANGALELKGRSKITIPERLPKYDVEVDYPNHHQVIPDGREHTYEITISAHVLEQLLAAARQWSGTRRGETLGLHFHFGGPEDPVYVECAKSGPCRHEGKNGPDESTLDAVLMPMRI